MATRRSALGEAIFAAAQQIAAGLERRTDLIREDEQIERDEQQQQLENTQQQVRLDQTQQQIDLLAKQLEDEILTNQQTRGLQLRAAMPEVPFTGQMFTSILPGAAPILEAAGIRPDEIVSNANLDALMQSRVVNDWGELAPDEQNAIAQILTLENTFGGLALNAEAAQNQSQIRLNSYQWVIENWDAAQQARNVLGLVEDVPIPEFGPGYSVNTPAGVQAAADLIRARRIGIEAAGMSQVALRQSAEKSAEFLYEQLKENNPQGTPEVTYDMLVRMFMAYGQGMGIGDFLPMLRDQAGNISPPLLEAAGAVWRGDVSQELQPLGIEEYFEQFGEIYEQFQEDPELMALGLNQLMPYAPTGVGIVAQTKQRFPLLPFDVVQFGDARIGIDPEYMAEAVTQQDLVVGANQLREQAIGNPEFDITAFRNTLGTEAGLSRSGANQRLGRYLGILREEGETELAERLTQQLHEAVGTVEDPGASEAPAPPPEPQSQAGRVNYTRSSGFGDERVNAEQVLSEMGSRRAEATSVALSEISQLAPGLAAVLEETDEDWSDTQVANGIVTRYLVSRGIDPTETGRGRAALVLAVQDIGRIVGRGGTENLTNRLRTVFERNNLFETPQGGSDGS